jgi:hypothetical protein
MSLIEDLVERPFDQAITSRYTAMNGLIYLGAGTLVLVWPGMVQTIFRDAAFVGNEAALIRVMGMTVMVIGWLYLFGGLSGGRRIVCSRLRFSTRRSASARGCFSVDPTALDFTRLPARHNCKSRSCEVRRVHYCGEEIRYGQSASAIVPLPLGTATTAH